MNLLENRITALLTKDIYEVYFNQHRITYFLVKNDGKKKEYELFINLDETSFSKKDSVGKIILKDKKLIGLNKVTENILSMLQEREDRF